MTERTGLQATDAARLQLATMRLARRLRRQAPEGVTPSQLSALSSIDRSDSMTLGELAAVERVQPPTMTKIVAALETAGLVTKRRDPDDRRSARVSLTKQGKTFVERNRNRKTAHLVKLSQHLHPREVQLLVEFTHVAEKMMEEDV